MKLNTKGFSGIETLLIVVIIGIIGGTGYYIYHANQKTNDTFNNSTNSANSSPSAKKKKTNSTAEAKLSDKDQIIVAVKAYDGAGASQANYKVTVTEIVGVNARGSFHGSEEGTGAAFVAHKSDGKWTVIFEGQQAPDKTVGEKYGLPAGWYTAD